MHINKKISNPKKKKKEEIPVLASMEKEIKARAIRQKTYATSVSEKKSGGGGK